MLGAKDVAFPKLNLLSFYIYCFGALGPGHRHRRRRTSTPAGPSTRPTRVDAHYAVIWMTLGVFILGFSSILTGVNFIVTIHKMRAPGMTWNRLPLFIWAIYATSVIQVLATPVLAITLLLLVMERRSASASSTRPSAATRCSSSTSSGSTRTRPSTS
jgi:cytochrome c oxidase subunit 1